MSRPRDPGEPDAIDLLLPWHAVERLSPEDASQVEAALAREPARARHLAAVREERAETVALNQDLGAPSRAARDALFARIATEGRKASPRALSDGVDAGSSGQSAARQGPGGASRPDAVGRSATGGPARQRGNWLGAWLGSWLGARLAGLAPSTLAWSGAAAAAIIALQAGLLAGAYRAQAPAGFETASGPESTPAQGGPTVLVAFAPAATAARIDALLRDTRAVIVDGPRAGGLYRLRLTEAAGGGDRRTGRAAEGRDGRGPVSDPGKPRLGAVSRPASGSLDPGFTDKGPPRDRLASRQDGSAPAPRDRNDRLIAAAQSGSTRTFLRSEQEIPFACAPNTVQHRPTIA